MNKWRRGSVVMPAVAMSLVGAALLGSGCTNDVNNFAVVRTTATQPRSEQTTSQAPTSTTQRRTTSTTSSASSSSTSTTTTSNPTPTSTSTTTSTTSTTTTTTVPPIVDPTASVPPSSVPGPDQPPATLTDCLYVVSPGEGLSDIVALYGDDTITIEGLVAENRLFTDILEPGQLLDVCVGDSIDAVALNTPPPPPLVGDAALVAAQQTKLNELFDGLGIAPLEVDGDSGAVTEQRLCAWRLTVGLPASRDDMAFGSDEERLLMATPSLAIPTSSATESSRWVLIDQTCQIMFVGESTQRLVFVFPTSTGISKYRTRLQDRSPAFKYNPAARNNGWHDSYDYPSSSDNPLNGNMYRPVYFDRGQAIHGANNVPRKPASHGCARLRVGDMDSLIGWLGLDGYDRITTDEAVINLTVNIQGTY